MTTEITIDKELIRERFRKSLSTYDEAAIVQKKMAIQLAEMVLKYLPTSSINVFEAGCGTGVQTREIVNRTAIYNYWANDIVPDCFLPVRAIARSKCENGFGFQVGDVEKIQMAAEMDLIISGSVVQWFANFEQFVNDAYDALQPEGIFAFSTFGQKNYHEIIDFLPQSLSYLSSIEVIKIATSKFELIESSQWEEKLNFSSALEVLQHFKKTGVNAISRQQWNVGKVRAFESFYQQNHPNKNYPLTYHPQLFVFRKREE